VDSGYRDRVSSAGAPRTRPTGTGEEVV
jgi:hypothetical protein